MNRVLARTPRILGSLGRPQRAVLSVAVGFAYGLLTSKIPSPHEIGVFWVSNLAAPWLALAFFAGRSQDLPVRAVFLGAVTDIACVVGFYLQFLRPLDPLSLGLAPSAPLPQVVSTAVFGWVSFAAPWFVVALIAGSAFGALGWWSGFSRSAVPAIVLAFAFLLEPVAMVRLLRACSAPVPDLDRRDLSGSGPVCRNRIRTQAGACEG